MSEMAGEVLALAEALNDERFAKVDMELRRGCHIHRDQLDEYEFVSNAKRVLDEFYRRYSCELVHRSDGYFFLLPTGDLLPRRSMSLAEMIVGQGLALCYLDPALLAGGGLLSKDELLSTLASAMGNDSLMRAFNPRKKRLDERIAQRNVRQRVSEALRRLAGLGFITLHEGEKVQLHASLMRFAEPVRGAGSTVQAMQRLLASGEVTQGEDDSAELDETRAASAETDDLDELATESAEMNDTDTEQELGDLLSESAEADEADTGRDSAIEGAAQREVDDDPETGPSLRADGHDAPSALAAETAEASDVSEARDLAFGAILEGGKVNPESDDG